MKYIEKTDVRGMMKIFWMWYVKWYKNDESVASL